MEELPSEEDNTLLQARDEFALLGPAADVWAPQDMQDMFNASQIVGMVGQPSLGSFISEPVEGQLKVPPLQEEVVELDSGDEEVPEDVPMDPEPSPQAGPHSLPLPSVPMSVAQEEHERGEPVLETQPVGSVRSGARDGNSTRVILSWS